MNMGQLKEKYKRFRQWQERPYEYKLKSDEVHHCNNCDSEFTGNFCPICSQKAGMGRVGWRSVQQGVMDIWGLGTRSLLYSVWQLLLRPGHIISDYIDGKRQVSFPPVKMLFILTLIYSFVVYWFLPNVFHVSIEEDVDKASELYQWVKNHYSWTMLIMSTLAIIPTWVMFRYSPRHTHHTLPEGFFIQVFLQIIGVALSFLIIPLVYAKSPFLTLLSGVLMVVYYVIVYMHLFGYNLWGTLWRQGFVLLSGVFTMAIVVIAAFPYFITSSDLSDSPYKESGYIMSWMIVLAMPLIILVIGHVVNLIATRKYRKKLKESSASGNV